MLIQSSVRSGRNLLWEEIQTVVTFTMGENETTHQGSKHWPGNLEGLCLDQNSILDIFPLQTGIYILVRSFHRLTSFNGKNFLEHSSLDCYFR